MMGRPVAMFEVLSQDAPRAQAFYAELFDWKIDADPEPGGYGLVDTGSAEGSIIGGIGGVDSAGDGERPGVKIYMRVDDLDAYLARAEALGGKRLVPPTALPGEFGSYAVFADPDGNPVGLWA